MLLRIKLQNRQKHRLRSFKCIGRLIPLAQRMGVVGLAASSHRDRGDPQADRNVGIGAAEGEHRFVAGRCSRNTVHLTGLKVDWAVFLASRGHWLDGRSKRRTTADEHWREINKKLSDAWEGSRPSTFVLELRRVESRDGLKGGSVTV